MRGSFYFDLASMRRAAEKSRSFPGKRGLNVLLRTVHIIGVVLFALALLTAGDVREGAGLLFASGLAMLVIDTWARPGHLCELAGAGILLKLGLIGLSVLYPSWAVPLFWIVLVISTLLSHAPGPLRHWRMIGRDSTAAPRE